MTVDNLLEEGCRPLALAREAEGRRPLALLAREAVPPWQQHVKAARKARTRPSRVDG
jgi:hypothetical protein